VFVGSGVWSAGRGLDPLNAIYNLREVAMNIRLPVLLVVCMSCLRIDSARGQVEESMVGIDESGIALEKEQLAKKRGWKTVGWLGYPTMFLLGGICAELLALYNQAGPADQQPTVDDSPTLPELKWHFIKKPEEGLMGNQKATKLYVELQAIFTFAKVLGGAFLAYKLGYLTEYYFPSKSPAKEKVSFECPPPTAPSLEDLDEEEAPLPVMEAG
jgi:hypothetical protein